LIQGVETLRDLNRRNRREVPEGAPLPFHNKQWKRLVREDGKINRRLYETAVLSTLRDRLRAGDVWIEGTRNYRRFDTYLLSKPEAIEVASRMSIETHAGTYLGERARTLDWRLTRFSRLLRQGKLHDVSWVRGKLKVVPLPPVTPPEAEALDRRLDALLPRVRITELLREVARRTSFLSAFRDLRTGKTHDNPNAVLAAVLADGTNLGLERMANASQGVTYAQLAWTHNWYLSEENYRAALATIVDAHHHLPFARHWGDGSASSSDGQFFRAGHKRAGASEVNAKYGCEPGPQDLQPPFRPFRLVPFARHLGHCERSALCARWPAIARRVLGPSSALRRHGWGYRPHLRALPSAGLPVRAASARPRRSPPRHD